MKPFAAPAPRRLRGWRRIAKAARPLCLAALCLLSACLPRASSAPSCPDPAPAPTAEQSVTALGAAASEPDAVIHGYATGVFIAPELSSYANAEEWDAALQNMRDIGMDTLIIQYCYQRDSLDGGQAYFDLSLPDTVHDAAQYPLRRAQIGFILDAATRHGMQAYLGLQLAEREWFDEQRYQSHNWLIEQAAFSLELAEALWDAFGSRYADTIAGWYLPFEWMSDASFAPYMAQITDAYYVPLTEALEHSGSLPDLPVMISPLIYRGDDRTLWAQNLATVLSRARIDVLAIQDGLGYGTQDHDTVTEWFRLARDTVDGVNAAQGRSIELWGNCENYARLRDPDETDPIERIKPMSVSKFITGLGVLAPYTDKLVTFSIHRFDTAMPTSSAVDVNRSYYEAYKRYYETGTKPVNKSDGYYVAIRAAHGAALTFHPEANAGLTDGLAADPADRHAYLGVRTENGAPFSMEIRFDDPTEISCVTSRFLEDRASAVALPKELIYEYLIRFGEHDEQTAYVAFHIGGLSGDGSSALSIAALAAPVVADGVRITVTPAMEWTFIDDVYVV